MNTRLYHFLTGIYRVYTFFVHPITVSGLENLPKDGPFILCCNHISLEDPMLLSTLTRRDIRYMAKSELFQNKLFGRFLRALGAFPVSRGEVDLSAFRASMAVLKEGGILGIFPQGHRYKRDDVREMHGGVALIALRCDATVFPVKITGPYRPFHRLTVRFGVPVDMEDLRGKKDGVSIREATRRIGEAIFGEC